MAGDGGGDQSQAGPIESCSILILVFLEKGIQKSLNIRGHWNFEKC